jgi:hypothetical protein
MQFPPTSSNSFFGEHCCIDKHNSTFTMRTNALASSLLFWAATALLLMVATTRTMTNAQCTFSPPIILDDGVTLEQVKNSAAGTFTMRLTYTGGNMIGIGINSEGSSKMVPGTAVIGRMMYGAVRTF